MKLQWLDCSLECPSRKADKGHWIQAYCEGQSTAQVPEQASPDQLFNSLKGDPGTEKSDPLAGQTMPASVMSSMEAEVDHKLETHISTQFEQGGSDHQGLLARIHYDESRMRAFQRLWWYRNSGVSLRLVRKSSLASLCCLESEQKPSVFSDNPQRMRRESEGVHLGYRARTGDDTICGLIPRPQLHQRQLTWRKEQPGKL